MEALSLLFSLQMAGLLAAAAAAVFQSLPFHQMKAWPAYIALISNKRARKRMAKRTANGQQASGKTRATFRIFNAISFLLEEA